MRNRDLFIAVLLGTMLSIGGRQAAGQDNCWITPCDPQCVSPSERQSVTLGGWVETGIYTNSHGNASNGPMHTASNRRTDFLMNQLYLFAEKELNTRRGFDWGARADFVYGVDAPGMQCYGDETFDFDWGANEHGYGLAAYQLYGTLGYKNLNVKIGKFITPIGWEASASKDNFFYSHSYCYWIEPATHTGVLADYNVSDRLTVSAGWVTGEDSSFAYPKDNKAVLTGFSYALTDNATVYYWFNGGREGRNPVVDYFVQSFCLEWDATKRLTYVMQYNLRNDNAQGGGGGSAYGINNHFLFKLNDCWGIGMRAEWLRDKSRYIHAPGDYYQVTWGLNWRPHKNLCIRPEVRYDWCDGASPYAGGKKKDQISAGNGVVLSF